MQFFHKFDAEAEIPVIHIGKQVILQANTQIRHNGDIMVTNIEKCILCGRPISGKGITEKINGIEYVFDKEECALMFKKLKSVYGEEFCVDTC